MDVLYPDDANVPSVDLDGPPDPLDVIQRKWGVGSKDVLSGYASYALSLDGDMPQEERLRRLSVGQLGDVAANEQLEQDYEASPWYVRLGADVAGMIPSTGTVLGAGALSGLAGGAAVAPAALATVEAPAVSAAILSTGFSRGFSAGSFGAAATLSTGSMYKDLIIAGVPHDTAKNFAGTYGIISGGLEMMFEANVLKSLGTKAWDRSAKGWFNQQTKNPHVQKVLRNTISQMGWEVFTGGLKEAGSEAADTVAADIISVMAKAAERIPAESITLGGEAEKFGQTFSKMLLPSMLLGAGFTLGGAAGGSATKWSADKVASDPKIKEALAKFEGKDIRTVLKEIKENLDATPRPWESTDTSVDFDENDNPVVVKAPKVTPNAEGVITGQVTEQVGAPVEFDVTDPTQGPTAEQVAQAEGGAPQAQTTAEVVAQETADILDALVGVESAPKAPPNVERYIGEAQDFTPMTEFEQQAYKNQITSDLRMVNAKIKELKSEKTLADKTGKPVQRIDNRLAKLNAARIDLKQQQELVDLGAVFREDVSQESGKVRMKKLAKMVDATRKAVEKANTLKDEVLPAKVEAATEKGRKQGARETTQQVKAMRAQIKSLIDAATPSAKLRKHLYKNLNVASVAEAKRALSRIDSEIKRNITSQENARQQKVREKLAKSIAKTIEVGTPTTKNGIKTNVRLDADTTKKLQTFKNYLNDPVSRNKTIQTFVADNIDALTSHDMSSIDDAALEDYRIASMAHNIGSKSEIELNKIKDTVAQWVADGRAEAAAKIDALRARRAEERTIADMAIGADAYINEAGLPSEKRKAEQAAASLASEALTFDGLMRMISPLDTNGEFADMTDVTVARRDALRGKSESNAALSGRLAIALKQSGFDGTLTDKIFQDTYDEMSITSRTTDGKTKTESYTRAQLIDIWMKMQDATLHERMREKKVGPDGQLYGNNWSFTGDVPKGTSFQEIVEDILTDQDKAVGQALLDFYGDYYHRANDFFRGKFGIDMTQSDNYSPVSVESYEAVPGTREARKYMFTGMTPGSAKERTSSLKAIKPKNAYSIARDHIDDWEHYMAFDELTSTLKNVFKSGTVFHKAVTQQYGSGTWANITDFIERFITDEPIKQSNNGFEALTRAMGRDISVAGLAFKWPWAMAMQTTSGAAMLTDYDYTESMGALKDIVMSRDAQRAFGEAVASSPILADRFKSGPTYDLSEAMTRSGVGSMLLEKVLGLPQMEIDKNNHDILTRLMFDGYRYGDALTARTYGAVVFQAEINRGATPEQAIIAVERAMERTQQSANVEQMPSVWAKNPILYEFFGKFKLQPGQLAQRGALAVLDGKRGLAQQTTLAGKRKVLGDVMRNLALGVFIPGFLVGVLKTLPSTVAPPGEDDQRDREAIAGILGETTLGWTSGVPFIGPAFEALALMVTSDPILGVNPKEQLRFLGDSNFGRLMRGMVDGSEAVQKLLENTKKDPFDSDAKDDKVKNIVKAVKGIPGVPGYPLAAGQGIIEAAENDDPLGAMMAAFGIPLSAVRKRFKGTADPFGSAQEDNKPSYLDTIRSMTQTGMEAPVETQEPTGDTIDEAQGVDDKRLQQLFDIIDSMQKEDGE